MINNITATIDSIIEYYTDQRKHRMHDLEVCKKLGFNLEELRVLKDINWIAVMINELNEIRKETIKPNNNNE